MSETVTANGRNGQVTFDGKTVTIAREGFAARASHGRGEKSIPIRQIAAVQFKPNALTTVGFIQFTVPGEQSSRTSKGGRTMDAAKDENAVLFAKKAEPEFIALRDAVRAAIAEL
ncbi:DUF4429 domain-containing protein [Microbacterium telephonicum]|uniref:Uncharacterized protein DUF4429 n=1 Tax=Microbacterium telephonicum TaxID=1714841 RepID=A0A498BZ53_9MICO|nr:DUF4429 domain-containing protein [Microbacterium telephonicum]RLK47616.1 uncharacterized protein DUF4429 [Microbacterium telephonicum]